MIAQALLHVRTAIVLRECAEGASSVAERRLLTMLAVIHEGRARIVIRSRETKTATPRR